MTFGISVFENTVSYFLSESVSDKGNCFLEVIINYEGLFIAFMINKIVLITGYWKNSPGGGVKTYLTGLSSSLEKRGCDVKVIFSEGSDDSNYKITGSRFLFPFKAFIRLLNIKPQVVHSHGSWYCLMAGFLYKLFSHKRLIHTYHSSPSKPLSSFGKLLMQNLVNKCDCVTFVSKALKADIENVYNLRFKTTAITYAGVSVTKVDEEETKAFRLKYNIPDNSTILLTQGFTANKLKAEGLKLLMKTVKKMSLEFPNLLLIATRYGVYSEELEAFAAELKIENHVVFTGDVENIFTPLQLADIYTHITLSEGGVSLALLEAMVSEKPIVATNIGGIPEAIDHMENGVIVEPDEAMILEAITLLLKDNSLAAKLSKNARVRAEKVFNWNTTSEQLLKIYEGFN